MYKIQNDQNGNPCAITIVGQFISIPIVADNTDYQQFLKDIKEGVELLDADGNVVTDFVPQES